MGLMSDDDLGEGDFKSGTTTAFFQSDGKVPELRDSFIKKVRWGTMLSDDSFSISAEILSIPTLVDVHAESAF